MGAYCPAPVVSEAVHQKIIQRDRLEPMHAHLSRQETPYRSVLFIGLMIDEHDDPYAESNVRFETPNVGDPAAGENGHVQSSPRRGLTDGLSNVELETSRRKFRHRGPRLRGSPCRPVKGRPVIGFEGGAGDINVR